MSQFSTLTLQDRNAADTAFEPQQLNNGVARWRVRNVSEPELSQTASLSVRPGLPANINQNRARVKRKVVAKLVLPMKLIGYNEVETIDTIDIEFTVAVPPGATPDKVNDALAFLDDYVSDTIVSDAALYGEAVF